MSEGKFYRVGGVNEISVDVRIIAATNQDLEAQVQRKSFRADLFHRLNVVRIALAPLRDRGKDIPQLISHFMKQSANQLNVEEKSFSQGAMDCLCAYQWPGQYPGNRKFLSISHGDEPFQNNHVTRPASEYRGLRTPS